MDTSEATEQYAAAEAEIIESESEEDTRPEKAMETGQKSAAMTSVIMTVIFVCMYIILNIY